MSTTTLETRIILAFDDNETISQTVSLQADQEDDAFDMIDRIDSINSGQASAYLDGMKTTFVSSAGASFVSIQGGSIIKTETEVIYP